MTYFDVPEKPPRHTCPLPARHPFTGPKGWRCDCGQAYVSVTYSDQREGTWQMWERAEQFDTPPAVAEASDG